MRIGYRVLAPHLVIMCLMAAASTVVFVFVSFTQYHLRTATQSSIDASATSNRIIEAERELDDLLYSYVLEQKPEKRTAIKQLQQQVDLYIRELESHTKSDRGKYLLRELEASRAKSIAERDRLLDQSLSRDRAQLMLQLERWLTLSDVTHARLIDYNHYKYHVLAQTVEDSATQARQILLIILTALLLSIGTSVGAFFLVRRNIIDPILSLTRQSKEMAEGKPLQPSHYEIRADEIGTLTRAFYYMAHSLQHAQEKLEATVEERTVALRTTLERERSLMAHLPIGVIALDPELKILEMNVQFRKIWNLPLEPAEMIGRPLMDFQQHWFDTFSDRQAVQEGFMRAWQERQYLDNYEIPLVDGRIINWDSIPIMQEGTFAGNLMLFEDITRQKLTDRVKSEFMSLASHQLRTPLTVIRWALRRALRHIRTHPEESVDILERAEESTRRMAMTIDTMLAISRLEAGQIQPRAQEVDACQLVRETVQQVSLAYAHKRQACTAQCPQEFAFTTDASILKEILANLLSNACKYTPDEGTIRATLTRQGDALRIDVTDNGYGIPAADQEKLFQKFFRGRNVVDRDTEGTGLGLYMVSLLVQLLHGTVECLSSEGRGTTFTVTLPPLPPAS